MLKGNIDRVIIDEGGEAKMQNLKFKRMTQKKWETKKKWNSKNEKREEIKQ